MDLAFHGGPREVGGNLGVARLQLLFFFPSRFVN